MLLNIPLTGLKFHYQIYSVSGWGEGEVLSEFNDGENDFIRVRILTIEGVHEKKNLTRNNVINLKQKWEEDLEYWKVQKTVPGLEENDSLVLDFKNMKNHSQA